MRFQMRNRRVRVYIGVFAGGIVCAILALLIYAIREDQRVQDEYMVSEARAWAG